MALDVSPQAREFIERGLEHYACGRLRDAVSEWENALALDPADARAPRLLEYVRRKLESADAGGGIRDTLESPIPQYMAVLTTESGERRLTAAGLGRAMAAAPVEDTRRVDLHGGAREHSPDRATADTLREIPALVVNGEPLEDLENRARDLIRQCREALRERRMDDAAMLAELTFEMAESAPSPALEGLLQSALAVFERALLGYIGDARAMPIPLVPAESLAELGFDHHAAFLLSRMNGLVSVGDVLNATDMPRFDALRVVAALLRSRAIEIVPLV
jgi:tetratricopeptide (TPR) repeat protein